MIDLMDVTLNIPVRYDTDDRINNMNCVLKYFTSHFKINIVVCEESEDKKFEYVKDYPRTQYIHISSSNVMFHRTKCLNMCAKNSTTPYIANYDCDVLFKQKHIFEAVQLLRDDKFDMVFPYAGIFYEVPKKYIDIMYTSNYNFDQILLKDCNINHPSSVGGAIFWNRNKFISLGMENENFLSWGYEDNERVNRTSKLGGRIGRSDGHLYHISHDRLINSAPNINTNLNKLEFDKVSAMSSGDLIKYIQTWEWCNNG
jgi:predicted glycosyltransferase involved in capsule biosynthesis